MVMAYFPTTANDDQPRPISRRHKSTGGWADQSRERCTSRIWLSPCGPRNRGESSGEVAFKSIGDFTSIACSGAAVRCGTHFQTNLGMPEPVNDPSRRKV